jgi:hypothetical protein
VDLIDLEVLTEIIEIVEGNSRYQEKLNSIDIDDIQIQIESLESRMKVARYALRR